MEIIFLDNANNKNLEGLENLSMLKVDAEPQLIQILSEPCLLVTTRGYQPVVRVMVCKRKQEYMMYISAVSLAQQIERLRLENNGQFTGLQFWIKKALTNFMI